MMEGYERIVYSLMLSLVGDEKYEAPKMKNDYIKSIAFYANKIFIDLVKNLNNKSTYRHNLNSQIEYLRIEMGWDDSSKIIETIDRAGKTAATFMESIGR